METTTTESTCQTCQGHLRLVDSNEMIWSHDAYAGHDADPVYQNDLSRIQVPETTPERRSEIILACLAADQDYFLEQVRNLTAAAFIKLLDLVAIHQDGRVVTIQTDAYTMTGRITAVYANTEGICINLRDDRSTPDNPIFTIGPVYGAKITMGTAPAVTLAMIARHRAL